MVPGVVRTIQVTGNKTSTPSVYLCFRKKTLLCVQETHFQVTSGNYILFYIILLNGTKSGKKVRPIDKTASEF